MWAMVLSAAVVIQSSMVASWYGPGFHGRTMANGHPYNQYALTCAHKKLPFGTKLKVTFKGKSVVVTVTDRGPYIKGRDIDLSMGAAQRLGMIGYGVARVKIEPYKAGR